MPSPRYLVPRMRASVVPSFLHRRLYNSTSVLSHPTALHRAERAADLKTHPESAISQEKLADVKHNHHWTEENATQSEADVRRAYLRDCYIILLPSGVSVPY